MKFLAASFKGWIYCRDHVKECTNIVAEERHDARQGPPAWQMNEINALIWPNQARHRRHGPGRVRADGEDRADSSR